jgi:gliding motility-associated-like protein
VITNYQFKNTCSERKTFSFKNLSKGNLSNCTWIFGDGIQYNNCIPISHSYTTEGKYQTKLYVNDLVSGCQDSSSQNIYITNPILINTDESICVNQSTEFKLLQNKRNPPSNLSWSVLGNAPINHKDTIYTIIADSTGIFENKVIINNGNNYCKDTIFLNHHIKVTGPKVDFIIPKDLCLYDSLKIINLSHSFQQTDSIKYWNWNFGVNSFQEHVFQPKPFIYTEEKTYSIKLVAIDKLGCKDSLIKKVKVHPMPFLWIIPKLSKICSDQYFTLTGYTSDTITWISLSNNYCVHCDTILISLNNSKNIFATSINQFGCSTSDSSTIIIIPKFNALIKNNDTSICMDNAVQLEVTPRNKITKWIPNDFLNNTAIFNPISRPNRNIKYNVILKDSMNCFTSIDSVEIKIFKSPIVDAGENKSVSFNSVFSFIPSYSNNIKDYLWTPSNKLSCNNCPYPFAIINESTKFTINVTSDSGCKAKDEITIYISCKNANILLPSAFSPNRDNLNDLYRPITRGIKTIEEFLILNKYGQVLYQKQKCIPNDNQTGWDGKYLGKEQEQGAYVYIIKAVCDVGETIIEKGSFLLLR